MSLVISRPFLLLLTVALLSCLLFSPSTVLAHEEKGEKEAETRKQEKDEEWAPTTTDPFITDSAYVSDPGAFTLQTFVFYSFIEGSYNDDWHYKRFKGEKHRTLLNYNQLSVGIWKDLELNLAVPYVYNWAEFPHDGGGQDSHSHGDIGDVAAWLKYQLIAEDQNTWKPSVAALFQVKAPTGRHRSGNPDKLGTDITGNGATEITLGLNVSKKIKPVILHANLWYDAVIPFRDQGKMIDIGDIIFHNLAVEWVLHDRLVAVGELNGSYQFRSYRDGKRVPHSTAYQLSATMGFEFILHKHENKCLSALAGVNIPIVGLNSNFAVTPIISLAFSF